MIQYHAGIEDADVDELDGDLHRCEGINQAALDWAMEKASPEALERYNRVGKKLVMADDNKPPVSAGPIWIWTALSFKDNKDATETDVVSTIQVTSKDYWEYQVQGFHYCKLLSPYRALEWIYSDSLHSHDGRNTHTKENKFLM